MSRHLGLFIVFYYHSEQAPSQDSQHKNAQLPVLSPFQEHFGHISVRANSQIATFYLNIGPFSVMIKSLTVHYHVVSLLNSLERRQSARSLQVSYYGTVEL